MHCEQENGLDSLLTSLTYTWFVFLYGSVFKITKHHLETIRIQSTQHPERKLSSIRWWQEIQKVIFIATYMNTTTNFNWVLF